MRKKNLQLKIRTTQYFGEVGGVALTSSADNVKYQLHLVYLILHDELSVFIISKIC